MVIDETGGLHGVRDGHAVLLLEQLPGQKAFGKELYPGIHLKSAVYVRTLIYSHPFIDGNKRTAMSAASIFLENNGYSIVAREGAIERFALRIIEEKLELRAIAEWFKENSRRVKKPA